MIKASDTADSFLLKIAEILKKEKRWNLLASLLRIVSEDTSEHAKLLETCDKAIQLASESETGLIKCVSQIIDLKIKYKKGIKTIYKVLLISIRCHFGSGTRPHARYKKWIRSSLQRCLVTLRESFPGII